MIRHLDLFSGVGGFALAVRWLAGQTIGFCEIEDYPRRVLAKNFPGAPVHDDIHTLTGDIVAGWGGCDLITGGFPCQPYSVAGDRRGNADDRALWPQMARVIDECRPTYVLAENVPGIVPLALDGVLSDLANLDYTARAIDLSACAVDAPHRRARVWIMAHSTGIRLSGQGEHEQPFHPTAGGNGQANQPVDGSQGYTWEPEPGVGRVANGVPNGVDRVKALGNAIVPGVAYEILRVMLGE